jgi:hypothetical protein
MTIEYYVVFEHSFAAVTFHVFDVRIKCPAM